MHGRMTTFKARDIAGVEAQLDELGAKAADFPGQIRSEVIWNEDGAGVVMAIYDSAASAAEASKRVAALWGGLMPLLAGPPETTEFTKAYLMK